MTIDMATDEDTYTFEKLCRLVEEAIDYATTFDEPEFDTALEEVGLTLGHNL